MMFRGFLRLISTLMLYSRRGGDLLAGMWQLIEGWGRVRGRWSAISSVNLRQRRQ